MYWYSSGSHDEARLDRACEDRETVKRTALDKRSERMLALAHKCRVGDVRKLSVVSRSAVTAWMLGTNLLEPELGAHLSSDL